MRFNRDTVLHCIIETLVAFDIGIIAALALVAACVVAIQSAKLILLH